MLYLHNISLLLPDGLLPDGAVLIEGSRITAVDSASRLTCPENATPIAGDGLILAPGFIDLQLNGAFGHDFTTNPDTIWRVAADLPRYGVTSFLPTIITSPPETIRHAQDVMAEGRPSGMKIGARPWGLHLEGPFLNPTKRGAHNPAFLRLPSLTAVADWTAANHVALVTLAPELTGALNITHALRRQGVQVSAGHSVATLNEAQAGFEAGIRYGTHLFNAMPPLGHREPGLAGALLTNDIVTGIIADGIHVHPAMVRLAWHLKKEHLTLVTDAMAALGMAPGKYQIGDLAVTVTEESARLADGTLAGTILALDTAVQNLMRFAHCSLAEAITTVTQTPARLLGLDQQVGHIAPGYTADLVWLTAVGEVRRTMVAGEIVYQL